MLFHLFYLTLLSSSSNLIIVIYLLQLNSNLFSIVIAVAFDFRVVGLPISLSSQKPLDLRFGYYLCPPQFFPFVCHHVFWDVSNYTEPSHWFLHSTFSLFSDSIRVNHIFIYHTLVSILLCEYPLTFVM